MARHFFHRLTGLLRACALLAAICAASVPARAQSPAEFYAGKTIEIYVGSSVGAGYDLYARLLSRHWSRHIPGAPAISVRNMDGAGGLRAANWVYNVGARDGTVVGTFGRGISFEPLLGMSGGTFEAAKFGWIGSMNDEVSVCVSWRTSDVATFDDLRQRELTVGASGRSGDSFQFPAILNGVFGTKMKIVTGYPGGSEIDLAMERGEVNGRCGWSWSSLKFTHPTWYPEKKINVLTQLALSKHPDLLDKPVVTDFARTEEEMAILRLIFARQAMAWPYMTPPGVPRDRLGILRTAFEATVSDPAFLDDARKGGYEVRPVKGAAIEALVAQIYQMPRSIADSAARMMK